MPAASETRVWLLRHATSTFNVQHRCQGACDDPKLTPEGREGARISGQRLCSEGIQAVICSPLRRAFDTAEQVLKEFRARNREVKFETDPRLREIELNHWEGLLLEEIARRFPEQYRDWRFRPGEFRMQLANEVRYPVLSLYDRVRLFWNHLSTTYAGKSILLVTHGGTIRALVASALGLGAAHFHSFQQSNCGVSRLRFPHDSRQARLDLLNDTAHLGDSLPKLKEGRRGMRLLLIPVSDANPAAIRRLAATLEGVVIDKLLVVGPTARSVASQLFVYFLDSYRVVSETAVATAMSQALHCDSGDRLRHVVILGPQSDLRRVLQRELCISATTGESLHLRPLAITSVHRPGNDAPSILQAMNMPESISSQVGA